MTMDRHEDIDSEIEALLHKRATAMQMLENRSNSLKSEMDKLHSAEHLEQWNSTVQAAIKNLVTNHSMLELSLDKLNLKTQLESCPAELMNEMNETFDQIREEVSKLEGERRHWEELEAQYSALGPKFNELLQQWTELEDKISVKEWALKELEKMHNSSGLDDTTLSDSFHT